MNKRFRISMIMTALVIFSTVYFCLTTLGNEFENQVDTIHLSDPDLTLQLPASWTYVTQNTAPDSPVFNEMGVEGTSYLELLKQNFIYIYALKQDMSMSVIYRESNTNATEMKDAEESELNDLLNTFLSADFNKVIDQIQEDYPASDKSDEISVNNGEIYRTDSEVFLECNVTITTQGVRIHGLQYYTVANGHALTINFNSLTEEPLTGEQKNSARTIIDTLILGRPDENDNENRDALPSWFYTLIGSIAGMAGLGIYYSKLRKNG